MLNLSRRKTQKIQRKQQIYTQNINIRINIQAQIQISIQDNHVKYSNTTQGYKNENTYAHRFKQELHFTLNSDLSCATENLVYIIR